AIGLRPAPVVADAHSDDAAEAAPHREAEIAGLEVALFEMLMLASGLRRVVAGQMNLAVLADDRAGLVDEDRCIEAPLPARLECELGVAEIETDREPGSLLEEGAGLRPRHVVLEPRVELRFVLDYPARKEAGQRQLGKDDDVGVARLRIAYHCNE